MLNVGCKLGGWWCCEGLERKTVAGHLYFLVCCEEFWFIGLSHILSACLDCRQVQYQKNKTRIEFWNLVSGMVWKMNTISGEARRM